ncbi:MAG TPA: phosphotransacetylase [Methanoculleus sp.]|nr:phosphotransacetylase [Methanoculleus sp.]
MKIGIGAGSEIRTVVEALEGLTGDITVVCYASPGTGTAFPPGTDVVESDPPEQALVADLASGAIDAAVRGALPASSTLSRLKKAMGVERLERVALLETAAGTRFLLAPVGVDEGWTISDKLALIEKSRGIARRFGLDERTAVLSGGRMGDVGRHERVDATLAEAELVARLAGADHTEILIEDAVRDHGIIIAPDGICGNLIFRTLVFLGGGVGHGAPVVNIDRIFVDTSRASPNYANAILLASALVK